MSSYLEKKVDYIVLKKMSTSAGYANRVYKGRHIYHPVTSWKNEKPVPFIIFNLMFS